MDLLPVPQRPVRLACVTETYPPEVNGVALTLARLMDGLRQRGHSLQLVRPRQAHEQGPAAGPGEVLVRGMPIPRYAGLMMGLPCKRRLVELWTRERPDVVHLATPGPLAWSALGAATELGIPLCSEFRTNFHTYSRHYRFGWLQRPIMGALRRLHNGTRCTMVPTQALKSELDGAGLRNLVVVPRGVDLQHFGPQHRSAALRAQWGAGEDDPVVAYVGRLAPEKNLAALLQAFDAIRAANPRARFVVVGDGPLRDELPARCPGAVFAGQRRGEDLAAHYAGADLLLFPSMTETFGNVTTEAMASGLAVVAFDHAAAGFLIRDGDNGALVPLADTARFVRESARLALDLPACRALGARARVSAQALDWAGVVTQFERVLASVMQAPGAPSPADYALASAGRSPV